MGHKGCPSSKPNNMKTTIAVEIMKNAKVIGLPVLQEEALFILQGMDKLGINACIRLCPETEASHWDWLTFVIKHKDLIK